MKLSEYKLSNKVTFDGYVYLEIWKGMYGLLQAGLIVQDILEEQLSTKGYRQSKIIPGLWNEIRPIQFALIIDNFGVMFVGEEYETHLLESLQRYYEMLVG